MTTVINLLQGIQGAAAVIGLAVLLLLEHAHPFFDLFRGSRKGWSIHLVRNLVLAGVNGLIVVFVFAGLWVMASEWAVANVLGLMNLLAVSLGEPSWLHAIGAILLLDAWTYTWHRINHRIPFLWRFHRVHHSDSKMDVTTAGRFHVGEIILSSTLRIPLIVLVGAYAWELILYETMMFAVVQFHHANIVLPAKADRVLRWFIVTPAMHKVHHSRLRHETDSNYSAFLSIWDRLFRSFRLRENLSEIDFGLNEFDAPEHASIKGLLRMPLVGETRQAAPPD